MAVNIFKLNVHLEAIPKLSILLYELICKKWSPQYSIEDIKAWFQDWKGNDIPLAFVALEADNPIGMCSLQLNDGIRSVHKPWLGDLCIDSAFQNQGIGKRLIDTAKNQARQQGYDKLYLFAPDPEILFYYQRLGWTKIGMDVYNGNPVTVMEIAL